MERAQASSDPLTDALVEAGRSSASLDGDTLRDLATQARLRAQLFPKANQGGDASGPGVAAIGPFVVLRKLGEGGMGVVYACYDERLDRKVAVKLLRVGISSEGGAERLRREALALAKLSHPNVVGLYEVGEHEGALFLAMEFVAGRTLRRWRAEAQTRGWRAALDLLIQAGRGLAAAHAAGLVHRDFKPDNVIVGDDGRVRVLDFGLARGQLDELGQGISVEMDSTWRGSGGGGESGGEGATLDSTRTRAGDPLAGTLTRHGALLGTPAYMAPEQLAARPCTPAGDQFAFCVTAYELLFGRRPFVAKSVGELCEQIAAGRLQAPEDGRAPWRVRRALSKGLRCEPGERWESMAALLAELEAALEGRRGALLGAGVSAALVTLGLFASQGAGEPPLCAVDASALEGTWDATRRGALREAFAASGLDFAPASAALVEQTLDGWAADWLAASRDACEATHVEGSQSQALLDRRVACLARERHRAEAVIDVLMSAGEQPSVPGRALELLDHLPALEVCADPRRLDDPFALPADAAQADALLAAFGQVSRAEALMELGRFDEAESLRARLELGLEASDYPPLRLAVAALAGEAALLREEHDVGAEIMLAQVREAEALGLDEFVAQGRARLARDLSGTWGEPVRERDLIAEAEAAVSRLGEDRPNLAFDLLMAELRAREQAGEFAAALALLDASAGEAASLSRERRIRRALERGRLLATLDRLSEAEAALEEARALAEPLGETAPAVAAVELDLGNLALASGALEVAATHYDRAQVMREAAFGGDALSVAEVRFNRSKLLMASGELEAALVELDACAEIYTAADWASARARDEVEEARGVLRFFTGDFEGSLRAYERSLDLRAARLGPSHPAVASLRSNIGESRAALGDQVGALAAYDWALHDLERALGRDHPDLSMPLKGRGQARLARGELDAAREDLERAASLVSAEEVFERADIQASLAETLHAGDAPGSVARISALVDEAAPVLREFGFDARAEALEAL
ncbi:protein kinase [Pseudenhygromyxa sp. WMMC2535]|uniref:serine/threonine-protein kinase n=1 Tax=Pseudenhygromyxa sp. WMMC2535 TaxID=2712867 RepID=UPI0015550050|nr:serine/threonine-protein kinase [Pseudenhygromyxa sp. WMMC2535]NVB38509.1 protein kinase [Pseudenhygromyxa sp. WMMC2535]